jgi:2-methylisocitrate lyase-like PEP mutase family enzyme
MASQAEKGTAFRALHERDRAFIIPNPWDVGTARLLQSLGFEALATTSAGFAFSIGKPDGTVDRETMLAHAADMTAATDLPVSGDLENGYGDDPAYVAETVWLAASAGLAGCSIEDVAARRRQAPYELSLAAERVLAAADVAHSLGFPFLLTARAENYVIGRPDLRDTIARLQAFQEAGAELSEIGVKRISVGSALSRAALGEFLRAAREMQTHGTFTFAEHAVKYADINEMFA